MAHGTDGEIITYDASGAPATVGVGTSGQVLTSNGAGSAPSMQSPAAAGADTSLSNLSATGENKVCQAWVNFNGTGTVAIRDSYNVSSITDNGTGLYVVNFSDNLGNSSYCVVSGGSRDQPEVSRTHMANIDGMTTSKFDITTYNDGSTKVNWALVCLTVFGD
jgi:hypothetical protein